MFKYNTLSDLLDGTLTTPLRKEGTNIVCQNEDGTIVNHVFSDFDFAKKIEERDFVSSDDLTSEMEQDLKETSDSYFSGVSFLTGIPFIKKPTFRQKVDRAIIYRGNRKISVETQIIRGKE